MALPLRSTTVSIYRPTQAQVDAEPYAGTTNVQRTLVASGVHAVIGAFSRTVAATEYRAGGTMAATVLKLTCDIPPSGIEHNDWAVDESTGISYNIAWTFKREVYGLGHYTCEIQRIEGAR